MKEPLTTEQHNALCASNWGDRCNCLNGAAMEIKDIRPNTDLELKLISRFEEGWHVVRVMGVGPRGFTAEFERLAWPRTVMFADVAAVRQHRGHTVTP